MAVDRNIFASACVEQAMQFDNVNPHYLVAVAELLSGIKDDKDGVRIGCFRRTQPDWDANGTAPEFLIALQPNDINITRMQCVFAALQTFRAQDKFVKANNGKHPSPSELYALWPNDPLPAGKTLQGALDSTTALIDPAETSVLAAFDINASVGDIQLDSISAAKRPVATQIINAFSAAGYRKLQQAAGVANAIAESGLDPTQHNFNPPKEDSVGLFQLNRLGGGLGKNNTVDELKDPKKNIEIIVKALDAIPAFKASTSLLECVTIFVDKVENPADKAGERTARFAIARKLFP
jgi:hypothetical protein